jgi:hypothetical protein
MSESSTPPGPVSTTSRNVSPTSRPAKRNQDRNQNHRRNQRRSACLKAQGEEISVANNPLGKGKHFNS